MTNVGDNTVSVIDAATRAVTATIPVGNDPSAVAADPAAGTVYVANFGGGTVSVIDVATRTVTATIPVGSTRLLLVQRCRCTPPLYTIYVSNI